MFASFDKAKKKEKSSSSSSSSQDADMKQELLSVEDKSLIELAKIKLRVSVLLCLSNITDKVDLAREKVILNSILMAEVYLSIKDCYSDLQDKSIVRNLTLAGCKLLTALGRSDKAKKVIVHEHANFD
jgi:hypothetical protein